MKTVGKRVLLRRMISYGILGFVMALGLMPLMGDALAQNRPFEATAASVNAGTVGIVTGPAGGTYIEIASDMSKVLDCVDGLRMLPIAGKGSVGNIRDLLYLKGVDMAIVQSDVLNYIEREGLFPSQIKEQINYITKLFNQEVHVVAKTDIVSLQQLEGKKVNIGEPGSLSVTADLIFDSIGVNVVPTKYDNELALARLQAGDLDAVVLVTGKPSRLLRSLRETEDLSFVPIVLNVDLAENYVPAVIRPEDYPNLIPAGEDIGTISVPTVLAVYAWPDDHPRYPKTETFVNAFFKRFGYFQRPARHPKWAEVSLEAEVPGWTRFPAAAERLQKQTPDDETAEDGAEAVALQETGDPDFEAFLADYGIQPRDIEEKQEMLVIFREKGGVVETTDAPAQESDLSKPPEGSTL